MILTIMKIIPLLAIIVYAAGGFKQLAIISSAAILIIYQGVAIAVIKLRKTAYGDSKIEIFKIPGGYAVPMLSVIIIDYFLSNLAENEMIVAAIFIGVLSLIYSGKKIFNKKKW